MISTRGQLQAPSKRATIGLPQTDDRLGKIGVDATVTGMLLQDRPGLVSTPIRYAISVVCTMPVSPDE
jgi:hypothetical protein